MLPPAEPRRSPTALASPARQRLTLDAGDRVELARAIRETGTTILLNAALPATNLVVMRACLDGGLRLHRHGERRSRRRMAPRSCPTSSPSTPSSRPPAGWRCWAWAPIPGRVTSTPRTPPSTCSTQVTELRVRDGDNSVCQGHDGFLAAFSPWVFIDECLCGAISWRDGRYHLEEALSGFEPFNFPELGILNTYYVDHEESRTLPMFFPGLEVADFKLCMDDVTWQTLGS